MNWISRVLLGLTLIFISSCDNEVDINADWKETIVVYGLINPNDSVQYIKVNKAFLNENISALVAAKEADSLYIKSVEVKLIEIYSGAEYTLTRVNKLPKDSGIFNSSTNYLYQTTAKIAENQPYKLVVKSLETGNSVEAVTWTVGRTRIEAPFRTSNPQFSLGTEYITISYVPAANSYAYDIKFYVQVDEFRAKDTGFLGTKNLKWNVITNFPVPRSNGGVAPTIIHKIERESLLQFLSTQLDSVATISRRIKSVGIEFYAGNQTLVDYISVNEPSIGIVQKQAEYSNVFGGYGLFASRSTQSIMNVPVDPTSIGILKVNKWTRYLNF